MDIALLTNGRYEIYKNDKKLIKNLNEMEYVMMDISTPMKGPVYSLVKANKIVAKSDVVEVYISISFCDTDCPADRCFTTSQVIKIQTLDNRYSVEPLIWQVYEMELFKDQALYIDPGLSIDTIHLKIGTGEIIDISDIGDIELRKIFKSHYMLTYSDAVFRDKAMSYIVLKNGRWKFTNNVPHTFDYIFIPRLDTNTLHFLSYAQYTRFSSVDTFSVQIYDISPPWIMEEDKFLKRSHAFLKDTCDEVISSQNPTNSIHGNILSELLDVMLFYPQLMEFEKHVLDAEFILDVLIKTDYRNYSLIIDEKDTSKPISFFTIINKLLQI